MDEVGEMFAEMGRYELLTAEDERRLFDVSYQEQAKARSHCVGPMPFGGEVAVCDDCAGKVNLCNRCRELACSTCRERMAAAVNPIAESNLRLATHWAKKWRNSGLPFGELIAEARFGLAVSLYRFELSAGVRFATYATWWIRQRLQYLVRNRSDFPAHVPNEVIKVVALRAHLRSLLGREPTAWEMAWHDPAADMRDARRDVDAAERAMAIVDVDTFADDGLPSGLALASVPDESSAGDDAELCESIMSCLTDREKKIIVARFWEKKSLSKVGEMFGVSKERIRQLQNKALGKMRSRSYPKFAAAVGRAAKSNGRAVCVDD